MSGQAVQAVIFDLDGLLVDSEPLWHAAEKAVLAGVGVTLSHATLMLATGLRVDEAVEMYFSRHPWDVADGTNSTAVVSQRVVDAMIKLLQEGGRPMPGIKESIAFFKSKGVPLALASSSPPDIIAAALDGLGADVKQTFAGRIFSAAEEAFGKPHPAVYLRVASTLGVPPTACLALEDSVTGAISAKAARMKCITVPDAAAPNKERFCFSDAVLSSLLEVDQQLWDKLCA